MVNINIITHRRPFSVGFDFYPLLKWKRDFFFQRIKFNYLGSHLSKKIFHSEILIVDYRYVNKVKMEKGYEDNTFIINFLQIAKKKGQKVILFDTGDGTGSRCFDLTPYVDIHLKKQLLKDLKEYTLNKGDKSYMIWIPEEAPASKAPYVECAADQLYKLRLGWNISMVDYRFFPLGRFYPAASFNFFNRVNSHLKFTSPSNSRDFDTSFRGTISADQRYSFQRNYLLNLLYETKDLKISTGESLSKKRYFNELSNSKIIVSPFGWGELCYRDFEAFIHGNLLLKPNVEHLKTFPDLFVKNETYIPLEWDMSDLKEKLYSITDLDYIRIASNAQDKLKSAINDKENFIAHFKNLLSYL